jgi:hypothetical protein
MKRIAERFSERSYDFIVVGGGMAGTCAAIEAARSGAKTALVHARPVLGGNASSEVRVHISGADHGMEKSDYAESGLLYELMLENKARNEHFSYSIWDMILFEAAKNTENLTVYYNTVLYDCETEGDRITAALCVQETTEMRYRLTAPLFADCTGNGTLGYFAGAEYRQGSESKAETGEPHAPAEANNERMGNTILMKAVDTGKPVKFTPPPFAKHLTEHQLRYRVHSKTMKVDASMAPDPEEWLRLSANSCAAVDYGYWWLELMGDGEDIIEDYSIGVLPSSELVKDVCETYEYEYSCGILGYPSCYVYLSAVFTEDDMFVAEINRIKDSSSGQSESDNKIIYTFRDDLEKTIGFYSDDKIEDGRTHIFSFAIVDEKEKSIEYFFAYHQESAGKNERISTILEKVLQIQ